jgi:hypothetical protein
MVSRLMDQRLGGDDAYLITSDNYARRVTINKENNLGSRGMAEDPE